MPWAGAVRLPAEGPRSPERYRRRGATGAESPHARLRPSRPSLHRPAGTPSTTAAARCPARPADIRTAAAFAEHLLREATLAGQHGVLLACDHDPAAFATWLSRFTHIAPQVGFAGIIGPADNGAQAVHPFSRISARQA
jgi:hypothetical protein